MSRAPAEHVARNRRRLHQLVRELRASARHATERSTATTSRQLLVLERSATRGSGPDRTRRARDLERLALALAAHDPQRTMARGYALVQDRGGMPLGSAAATREAGELELRFHDGSVPARVTDEDRES
jgi:exodeoxyribonuclease VII large subunit